MKTSLRTKNYFVRRKKLALGGFVVWFTAATLMAFPRTHLDMLFTLLPLFSLMSSPYTLRTRLGRIWWGAMGLLYACLLAARFLAPHSLFSPFLWIIALLCGVSGAVGLCLRWDPPPGEAKIPAR